MSKTSELQSSVSRVLLATDFSTASEAAFQASVSVCLATNASLYILNVFEYANTAAPETGGLLLDVDTFYQDAESSLGRLLEQAQEHGLESSGCIALGSAHRCILDYVTSERIDLVVLGTRSIHGFERLVFGSTAEAVLRGATCPVLTVGPQAYPRTLEMKATDGVVVFATDFHALTTRALKHATTFARAMGLPLHCLHVLPRGAEDSTRKGVLPLIIREGLQHLAENTIGAGMSPVCAVAYGSEISQAVVEYARQHHAKLVVLGVRRASLVASHVPAHIAYRIITEAPCPVLTIAYPSDLEETQRLVAERGEVGGTPRGVLH